MIRRRAIASLVACAGCGDNLGVSVDGPTALERPIDARPPCSAAFTGNFTETSSSGGDCPTVTAGSGSAVGDTALGFVVLSTTLGSPFTIAIDLGPMPSAGAYSSETVTSWSAHAALNIGGVDCLYSAGDGSVPPGSFALSLTAIDLGAATAHGTLDVVQYVLTPPFTNCGTGTTETIALSF